VLYKQGKYEDAQIWLDKALAHGGDVSGEIHEHLGDVMFKLDDLEAALEHWQIAKELGGASEFLDKKITDKTLYE
jgi:tetratricopeptide (TPR) repeat protein